MSSHMLLSEHGEPATNLGVCPSKRFSRERFCARNDIKPTSHDSLGTMGRLPRAFPP